MNAKIDWYREVLELEPGSKVFFPLARLLGESGESEEAVRVLRQGLERHPEYFEARLLLIELLHSSGADAAAELAGITGILCAYPGFWNAWKSQTADTGTALALCFLSAALHTPGLTLDHIFSTGLHNSTALPHAEAAGRIELAQSSMVAAMPAAEPSTAGTPGAGATPLSPASPLASAAVGAVGQDLASLAAVLRTRDGKAKTGSSTAAQASGAHRGGPPGASGQPPQAPQAGQHAQSGGSQSPVSSPPFSQSGHARAESGRATLRTRSMAEVLAEQGDVQGAIDIYTEILDAAPSGTEAHELHARIQSLRGKLEPASTHNKAEAADRVEPDGTESLASGKKVRNMLEHLADRLDVRAKS